MGCKGLHCDGCSGGGGLAVVLFVLAVIAAAAWHVRHGIETGLEIAMWTIAGAAGLVFAGGLVYGARCAGGPASASARPSGPGPSSRPAPRSCGSGPSRSTCARLRPRGQHQRGGRYPAAPGPDTSSND